jgi:tRNA1(Val) A37 N6-methylase TrmN6
MTAERAAFAISEDAVLGGRLVLRQPRAGHRVGHDAILLAAATDAQADEHAVDLGAGVGAAGLALAVRIPGLRVTLIEIDRGLATLAATNAQINRHEDRVSVLAADVEDRQALNAAGLGAESVDRVLMNPPFRDATRANLSPDPGRRLAHAAPPGLLERWIAGAAWLLKPNGVLTLIWRADELDAVPTALAGAFGSVTVRPVLPGPGRKPIRVLVRAVKGDCGLAAFRPDLILNDANGRPTAEAEAVLRSGKTLSLV